MPETLRLPYREANAIVEDQLVQYLMLNGDAAKVTDLMPAVSVEGVTPRVLREIMRQSQRFVSVSTRWDLAMRHAAQGMTMERRIDAVLRMAGRPLSIEALADELTIQAGRTPDYYEDMLYRFLTARAQYVELPGGTWAWREWILQTAATEEDVLFTNFFMSPLEAEVEAARPLADAFAWDSADPVGSAVRFVNSLDESISILVLGYLTWRACRDSFNRLTFIQDLMKQSSVILVPEGRAAPQSLSQKFGKVYAEMSLREEEPTAEEIESVEPEGPFQLRTDDLEQVFQLVVESDRSWRVAELADSAFDLAEGDRHYAEAVQQLNQMMVDDDRFLWVGTDRWREAGTLPEFVLDVPDQLQIQQFIFEDENHQPIDCLLDERGIDEGLIRAMSDLMVQDLGDRDDYGPEEGHGDLNFFEFWVLRHHRETGTLPLLPAYRSLFPMAPDIVEIRATTNSGQRFPLWVNDTLETIYGFGQWFVEADLPLSGALLRLSRTNVPGEYRLDYDGKTEPRLYIEPERMDELEMIKLEAESDTPLPTFDIVRQVLQHYGTKGAPFVRIWNEVNVVRRTPRMLLASLLSAYQCFVAVARGGDVWWYDEKRMALGINKSKRKFVLTP